MYLYRSRGIAIIINNDTFSPSSGMSARAGSSVDRDNLIRSLKYVGFEELVVRDNLPAHKMSELMKDGMYVLYSY